MTDHTTQEHQKWKCGNEDFAAFHPQASHVPPDWRDGWNACFKRADEQIRTLSAELAQARATNQHFRDDTAPRLSQARDREWERAQGLAEKVERLEARERACETMQQAEAIALVRMGQELAEAVGLDPLTATPAEIVAAVAQARAELEGLKAQQSGDGFHAALQKAADEWGFELEGAAAFFSDALKYWKASDTDHMLIPRSELIEGDSYGVYGSDFWRCKLCGGESGAGVLNQGIKHAHGCYLAAPPTGDESAAIDSARAGREG